MSFLSPLLHFIQDPQNEYGRHTSEFLQYCGFAILYSIIIGVFLGIVSAQNKAIAFLSSNISGLGRAIPTLAFFGLAAAIPLLGLNPRSAVIALTILGIPPILLNTVAGLQGIDPALTDAARGMGMTRLQRLTRVQLPLVLPVIAAGVRTAAVQIVATAPLATFIGAGGYGDFIIAGYGNNDINGNAELFAGIIPVVVLALLAEYGIATLQRALTPQGLRPATTVEIVADAATADVGKGVMAT